MHGVPHKHLPELEFLDFISPVSMSVLQLLEPDGMKRSHWLPPIDWSISHEVTEMLEHGVFLVSLHHLKNSKVS